MNPHVHKCHLVPETQGLKEGALGGGRGCRKKDLAASTDEAKSLTFHHFWGQKHYPELGVTVKAALLPFSCLPISVLL